MSYFVEVPITVTVEDGGVAIAGLADYELELDEERLAVLISRLQRAQAELTTQWSAR